MILLMQCSPCARVCVQVAQSLGLLIGATVMEAKLAQTVAAVVMLTMMLVRIGPAIQQAPPSLLGIVHCVCRSLQHVIAPLWLPGMLLAPYSRRACVVEFVMPNEKCSMSIGRGTAWSITVRLPGGLLRMPQG